MMAELTTPIVFIVDDDVHLRQALGNLFASVGMRVELFGSTSVPVLRLRFPHCAKRRAPQGAKI